MTAGHPVLDSGAMAKLVHPKVDDIAFGLDLGGLAGGNSRLAKAERKQGSGSIVVTIYHGRVPQRFEGNDLLEAVAASWGRIVARCLTRGFLVVDVPMDVQELTAAVDPHYLWQLTKRSIDYALGGQPPF